MVFKAKKRGLTAAHQTLPLPSVVKVTNLKNNKSVVVIVNDRGPFSHQEHRIIDLSEKAAEIIDMKKQGIAKVKVSTGTYILPPWIPIQMKPKAELNPDPHYNICRSEILPCLCLGLLHTLYRYS